ncbi:MULTISPECIES: putative holin-like toxin [unclassified Paenibacillus]
MSTFQALLLMLIFGIFTILVVQMKSKN